MAHLPSQQGTRLAGSQSDLTQRRQDAKPQAFFLPILASLRPRVFALNPPLGCDYKTSTLWGCLVGCCASSKKRKRRC